MKFKNLNLRAYRHNSLVTLSFDKKHDIETIAEQLKLSPVVVDRAVMELVARKWGD